MKQFLFGRRPIIAIAGYLIAILTIFYQAAGTAPRDWQEYLLALAIAMFGRLLAGNQENDPPSSSPETAARKSPYSFWRNENYLHSGIRKYTGAYR